MARKRRAYEEKWILLQENPTLKKEIVNMKPIVKKFTLSAEKLQMILSNQRVIFNIPCLDYNSFKKQKILKNFFVKSTWNTSTCFFYEKLEHKA